MKLNRSVPSHCCQRNSMIRTYLVVWRSQLCFASNVVKPGCTTRLTDDFKADQKIIICQLMIAGLIKATILAASFVIPFEQKVMLTETHDAISLASTISIEDLEERKDEAPVVGEEEEEEEEGRVPGLE